MEATENVVAEIRKLRKKLRQIENLERLDRPLNYDENEKIARKGSIRSLLQKQLKLQEGAPLTTSNISTYKDYKEEGDNQNKISPAKEKVCDSTDGHNEQSEDTYNMKRPLDHTEERDNNRNKRSGKTEEEIVGGKRQKEDRDQPSRGGGDASLSTSHCGSDSTGTESTQQNKVSKRAQPREKSEAKKRREHLSQARFTVQELEGHNDVVCSVDCEKDVIISGSRDTMVKAWRRHTGAEMCSLGGHGGTVTSVYLLTAEESRLTASHYELNPPSSQLALSASTDCSVRVWDLDSSKELRSIYTFNPVMAMAYLGSETCAVTGSDGGKVELWDIHSGDNVFSTLTHEGSVTCIQVSGHHIVTAATDGVIKLWEVRERSLHVIFESENIRSNSVTGTLVQRPIISLGLVNDMIYFGDDGSNVKVLDWRQGLVHKLRNHLGEFGSTDAMLLSDDILMFSAYDLDKGIGSINFFSTSDQQYLGTLSDEDTSRIVSIAAPDTSNSPKCFITAGQELKIWTMLPSSQCSPEEAVPVTYRPAFASAVEDSDDYSSESELSGAEEFSRRSHRGSRRRGSSSSETPQSSWLSWCSLV